MEDEAMRDLVTEIRAMREQLIRMDERMKMVQDHETRLRQLESYSTADHDSRISALEKWRYALPSALALAGGSGIAQLIQFLS